MVPGRCREESDLLHAGRGCGTGDIPAQWWDSPASGQCGVGWWQIKDSEEEEEGAELAPQDHEASWTR